MASLRKAGRHLLAARSVHLNIHPQPANLGESREILRVLQGFGAIDIYKTLRHERPVEVPNAAFAVYRDPEAAQKALNASPIRFALETVAECEVREDALVQEPTEDAGTMTQDGQAQDGVEEITRPSLLLNQNPEQKWGQFEQVTSTQSSSEAVKEAVPEPLQQSPPSELAAPKAVRWFHVNVDRARGVYQDYVERQPLYSEFSIMKSMMQEDLATRVPHAGLSDVTMRPDNFARTANRFLQKKAHERAEIKTLQQLWDDVNGKVNADNVVDKNDQGLREEAKTSWGAQKGLEEEWGAPLDRI